MAHRVDILEQIQVMVSAYPGQKLDEASIEVYIEQLVEMPLWLLQQAVQRHIHRSPWFPRISDLYRLAGEIANELDHPGLEPPGFRELLSKKYELKRAYTRDDIFVELDWQVLIGAFESIVFKDSAARARQDMQNIQREIQAEQNAEEVAEL